MLSSLYRYKSGRKPDNYTKTPDFSLGYKKKLSVASERRFMVISILLLLLFIWPSANARKIKTKHAIPKQSEKSIKANSQEFSDSIISLSTDSITFSEKILPAIRFSGFDKTVASTQESFFISNGLDDSITGMEITITYFDMKGRQLHKRDVNIDIDIPPHETMRTDIKSWDTQKSFYFHQSAKPKRQATPFNVKITLIALYVLR